MDLRLVLQNLLDPAILFFFLGMLAVLFKSDLEIPQPIPKFLSLYLLLSIGFHGGVELHHSGIHQEVVLSLAVALLMASVVPVYTFFILRLRLDLHDAAAIAATYGSVSAVTFITAASFLQSAGIAFGGHMVAALALMESPAIVLGVFLYRFFVSKKGTGNFAWPDLLRDAFLNGSVFLIMGSLVAGLFTGDNGSKALQPFTQDIFKGMLTFFLLDMGLVAAKRIRDLSKAGTFLVTFALLIPLCNAAIGIMLALLIGMPPGDALMFTILCASASYIAVPAAMRLAIPEANPSLYVPMALAITFPFNIIVGLPLYLFIINLLWR